MFWLFVHCVHDLGTEDIKIVYVLVICMLWTSFMHEKTLKFGKVIPISNNNFKSIQIKIKFIIFY
jgi:hypothetical protein